MSPNTKTVGNGLDRSAVQSRNPERKPTRLKEYDYSNPNYYYVTICTHDKAYLFGDAQERNQYGKIAEEELLNVPNHFPNVAIDRYVVMPNHIHVIFALSEVAEHTGRRPSLSSIVGLYKSGVARKIHQNSPNIKVWQKSFYDRILRNEEAYREVCAYIDMNPERWSK